MPGKLKSIIGDKYNKLTVVECMDSLFLTRSKYRCLCECGQYVISSGNSLRQGNTKSCGCLHRLGNNRKHGVHEKGGYYSWQHMKDRCTNPQNKNYKNYGGRGIQVCSEWLESFENFLV